MPLPFSEPPPKPDPTNWWKSISGQIAILVIAGGVVFAICGALGIIGPHAGR